MHISVLSDEAIEYLRPGPGNVIMDATVGCGGHSYRIAKAIGSEGQLIGLDCDSCALEIAKEKLREFGNRVILAKSNFRDFDTVLSNENLEKIDGALFDLGVSSLQLDQADRGFSFRSDADLDMRMDEDSPRSAKEFVNSASEYELDEALKIYGEERYHRRIAKAIVELRKHTKIETTKELAQIVYDSTPGKYRRFRIDPATRTFQAIRVAVNDELESIKIALSKIHHFLKPEARVVFISFNSLEDRIVKHTFRADAKREIYKILTKKPLIPTDQEMRENPRSRSAKLRAAQKNG